MSQVPTRLGQFDLDLHRAAAPDPRCNACWSPYSVTATLGSACAVARGRTAQELRAALTGNDPDADTPDLEALARALTLATEPGGGAELAATGAAWLREDVTAADGVREALASWPSTALRAFGADLAQARRAINAEVADATRGLIPELLGEGALTGQTYALLVAALYLRAAWRHPFATEATRPRRFDTPSGPVDVPTMETVTELEYADTGRWQVVTLPGEGTEGTEGTEGGVEANILLPSGPIGQAEASLTGAELDDLLRTHPARRIRLRLPRLRVQWRHDLADPLQAIGVRALFDADLADLTGLTPVRPVWVSKVLHQAVLRLDEQGMEGAAATALVVAGRALAPPPEEPLLVAVDRPFLLLVRHRRSGVRYFFARVTDPSS